MAVNSNVHICSRENCPPANVGANKIRCFACSKQFFGKCFGIDESFYDVLAPGSPFTEDSSIQFICPLCLSKPKQKELAPTDPGSDLGDIREKLNSIVLNQHVYDRKIKIFNQKIVDLVDLGKTTNNLCQNIDQKMNAEARKPLFSTICKTNNGKSLTTTPALKRFRSDLGPSTPVGRGIDDAMTPARPRAVAGTLDVVIGPSLPQFGPRPNLIGRRSFDRSLWVSRFHPDTTVEQMRDYIVNATGNNDMEQFNCIKLVKRDADLSALHFVSFKIEMNEELFVAMSDPGKWPKYVLLREFLSDGRNMRSRVARLPEPMETNESIDITPKIINETTASSSIILASTELGDAQAGSDNVKI